MTLPDLLMEVAGLDILAPPTTPRLNNWIGSTYLSG